MQSPQAAPLKRNNFALPEALRNAWVFNPTLTIFTVFGAAMTLLGVAGMLIDPRIVLGMPNWAKSTKFGMSFVLYGGALLWMLPMLRSRPRLAQFLAHASGAILLMEGVLLILQATRGVPMHFNVSTPFDATLWSVMSATITIFWFITAIGVFFLFREPQLNRVLGWSVRLGLLVTLLGFTQGYLMTGPNAPQMAALNRGEQLGLIGAHTVNAADGGPGLPLLGWSTEHGDLRIGHFVGIHAAQAIPLLGAALLRRRTLREGQQLALLGIGAAGYAGIVGLVTWQALRDQPLLSPDGLTLGVAGGLIAAVAVAAGIVLRRKQ